MTAQALKPPVGMPDATVSWYDRSAPHLGHPILLNRPIVVSPLGVGLCRPSEAVLDLLPADDLKPFTKEDGEVVIDAAGHRVAR